MRDVLRDVSVEAESLQRVIDDLLVMVRAERGSAFAVPEPVLLRRVVGLAVDDEARRWPEHDFVVALAPDLPTALGDDAPAPPGPAQRAVERGQVRPAEGHDHDRRRGPWGARRAARAR